MRKAMTRKGQRRSSQKSSDKGDGVSSHTDSVSTEAREQNKRKATEGEAVLTAKNYRLAKELSELRVRHREETKNVTRLTMENMNLASRCREAISHVSMLKKELTMHQRRAAEALALQREEVQRMSMPDALQTIAQLSSPRNGKTNVAAEMDRMDRLMAARAPPPPPPSIPPPRKDIAPVSARNDGSPTEDFFSDYQEEKKSPSEDLVGVSFNTKPIFPHSASPRVPDRNSDYNEGFPDDLSQSTRKKKILSNIFVESPAEIAEFEESDNGSVTSASDARKSIMNSLDAFEASFATDFSHSFSGSPKEGEQESVVYNPFLPSPQKVLESAEPSAAEIAKARNAPAPPQIPPSSKPSEAVSQTLPPRFPSPRAAYMDTIKNNSTPTRAAREVTPPTSYDPPATPPRSAPSNPTTPQSNISQKTPTDDTEQPRRPEKTASASARARYEKALQPRTYQTGLRGSGFRKSDSDYSDQPDSEPELQAEPDSPPSKQTIESARNPFRPEPASPDMSSAPSRSKSPSMVLKRLQERKVSSPSVSKTAIPSNSASPLIPVVSRKTASSPVISRTARTSSSVALTAANNQRFSSPSPSTASSPSPRTQSSGSTVGATPDGSRPPDLSDETPTKSSEVATSPSVSSAISVFEKAAKKGTVTPTSSRPAATASPAARPSYRSTFTPKTARTSSPASTPFDEDESIPTPTPPSASRTNPTNALSAKELQLAYGRRMSDEDRSRWGGTRAMSERELQSLAKKSAGFDGGSPDDSASPNENLNNSYPDRFNRGGFTNSQNEVSPYGATTTAGRNSRQGVRQPVSYAEPSLNSKLRRGDTYFDKDVDGKRKNGDNTHQAAPVRL